MSENTRTREFNQYPGIFGYCEQHMTRQGFPAASSFLVRELYGEQVMPNILPDVEPPDDEVIRTLDLLSQGFEVKDIHASTYYSVDGIRNHIKRAFAHYETKNHSIPHRRLTTIKTAIELGHIAIDPKPLNYDLLDGITVRQMTAFHLTELGYPRRIAARKMFLSEDGFKSQVIACKRNIGARNTSHAVRLMREQGIFQLTYAERVPRDVLQAAGIVFD
jgi:DNA-binding NarL/FixJ family response regulator